MLAEITDLYSYNKWANQETLRAAAELGDDAFATTLIRQLGGTPASTDHFNYCLSRDGLV